MKLSQETIDKKFSLPKQQSKPAVPETVHSKSRATSSLLRKPLRKFTKQSHLDYLHHNQESNLEHLKTHTLLGQHTNTKIADLDPLKNTQPISANT